VITINDIKKKRGISVSLITNKWKCNICHMVLPILGILYHNFM